jgi:hypothetical protein
MTRLGRADRKVREVVGKNRAGRGMNGEKDEWCDWKSRKWLLVCVRVRNKRDKQKRGCSSLEFLILKAWISIDLNLSCSIQRFILWNEHLSTYSCICRHLATMINDLRRWYIFWIVIQYRWMYKYITRIYPWARIYASIPQAAEFSEWAKNLADQSLWNHLVILWEARRDERGNCMWLSFPAIIRPDTASKGPGSVGFIHTPMLMDKSGDFLEITEARHYKYARVFSNTRWL